MSRETVRSAVGQLVTRAFRSGVTTGIEVGCIRRVRQRRRRSDNADCGFGADLDRGQEVSDADDVAQAVGECSLRVVYVEFG